MADFSSSGTKRCNACGVEKPLDQFYVKTRLLLVAIRYLEYWAAQHALAEGTHGVVL
jgi:hypothetical protein